MSMTILADHTLWSQLPLPCSPLNPTGSSALGSGCFFHLTTLPNFCPQLCFENVLTLPLWPPACGLCVAPADRPNSLPFLHAGALALNSVEQEGLSSQRQEFLEISQKISLESSSDSNQPIHCQHPNLLSPEARQRSGRGSHQIT